MYLFGSSLIKKLFPDFREARDIDWITNDPSQIKNSIIGEEEFYCIPFTPSREMTSDEIYTVKVSHAIYDIHWKKTMSDIRFLQIKGCKVIPSLLSELREHWVKIHGEQKRTNFEVDPGEFFDDRVDRRFHHDDLHKMINPSPTYLKMIDGVTPNPYKFSSLSDDDRKEVLFEEAFVISIERFQSTPSRSSYQMAQQLLVTKLHPVWISDIIIKNWNNFYWNCSNSKFYNNYNNLKK